MQTTTLSLNSVVVQRQGNIASDMNGSKVMLSIEKGKYYNLGSIGGEIWDLLQSPIKLTSLVEKLIHQFDVSYKECEAHVVSFIQQLLTEGLVVVVE